MKSILTKLIFKLNPTLRDKILSYIAVMRNSSVLIIHDGTTHYYMRNGNVLHTIKLNGEVVRGLRSKYIENIYSGDNKNN